MYYFSATEPLGTADKCKENESHNLEMTTFVHIDLSYTTDSQTQICMSLFKKNNMHPFTYHSRE